MQRVELCIFKNQSIEALEKHMKDNQIVNIYLKVDLSNLSQSRKRLIELGYTTRLFIHLIDGKKNEYIYGKLKGVKGVFKEHCKNSVFRNSLSELITISSNEHDIILTDVPEFKQTFKEKREWILI